MLAILTLGFFIGLKHAMEADHLAAVATIASRHSRPRDIIRHGLTWGLGHALTLGALGGAAFLLGSAIPERLANGLEFAVGIMLVALGAQVLWRLWKERTHVHVHEHGGERHLHVHSHGARRADGHDHEHGFRWRTLLVGFMHGMAGSAALLLLAMTQVRDPVRGLVYIAVFGVGSMVGMGILSAVIAVPLTLSARFLTFANNGLQGLIGVSTVGLGVMAMVEHWG
ncbi:MAG: urease accessory protein [Deltaproteobacteria bacterium]|nr:urease accessory protein [Deltaproteobacteria bacterium]